MDGCLLGAPTRRCPTPPLAQPLCAAPPRPWSVRVLDSTDNFMWCVLGCLSPQCIFAGNSHIQILLTGNCIFALGLPFASSLANACSNYVFAGIRVFEFRLCWHWCVQNDIFAGIRVFAGVCVFDLRLRWYLRLRWRLRLRFASSLACASLDCVFDGVCVFDLCFGWHSYLRIASSMAFAPSICVLVGICIFDLHLRWHWCLRIASSLAFASSTCVFGGVCVELRLRIMSSLGMRISWPPGTFNTKSLSAVANVVQCFPFC